MSWLNFNDSLNQLRGQLSNLAGGVLPENLVVEPDVQLKDEEKEQLRGLLGNQALQIEDLKKQNAELREQLQAADSEYAFQSTKTPNEWSWEASRFEEKEDVETIRGLQQQIKILKDEKRDLIVSLEQLDSDCQQTTEKVINLKDALQIDYNNLKDQFDALKKDHENLLRDNQTYKKTVEDLTLKNEELQRSRSEEEASNISRKENEKALVELEKKNEELLKQKEELDRKNQEIAAKLSNYQANRISDQERYDELSKVLQTYEDQLKVYKENAVKLEIENRVSKSTTPEDKDAQHFLIITETFKKFMDYSLEIEENTFSAAVESIMKLLLELKWKSETLQKEVESLTDEKTEIFREKKYEIEKLLENSEQLSQEVIAKNEALKHYEHERRELMKNNDVLIGEIEAYRSNPGLETISETNEDKLVLMESQLETANKRMKELEGVKDQLDITLKELTKREVEYKTLSNAYEEVKTSYSQCYSENEVLNDKIQTEFENSEYKFSEININMETLKEETETLRVRIEALTKSNRKLQQLNEDSVSEKEVIQNEVDDLKQTLTVELEARDQLENEIRTFKEKLQNVKMAETTLKLQYDKDLQAILEINKSSKKKCEEIGDLYKKSQEKLVEVTASKDEDQRKIENCREDLKKLKLNLMEKDKKILLGEEEIKNLKKQIEEMVQKGIDSIPKQELSSLQAEIASLQNDREQKISSLEAHNADLINRLKEKHDESNQYYHEIQRLNQILAENHRFREEKEENLTAQNEKLADQNAFLKDKCDVLAQNLLQEQAKLKQTLSERDDVVSEKEIALGKELQRLREHLLEIEEMHTQEMMSADRRNAEMQSKVSEIEHREKEVASLHTSANIRANQHVETLQNQLQMVTSQRDELRRRLSDAEDVVGKQTAGLANLEFVLRQFQEDKEKGVLTETERMRKQVSAEKMIQEELRKELVIVRIQLDESKQGLLAASRLSDQVETSKLQVAALKDEVQGLQEKLQKSEQKYNASITQVDAKVDKMLVKNLVVGFISSNSVHLNKDQHQILKIIATVLDFNQQDNEKVKLYQSAQGSWLNNVLHPNVLSQNQEMSQESLSQAFVRFLENESKPRQLPNLLNTAATSEKDANQHPQQQASLLSEVVLPTFADFGQSRNSSSILKDVLKDNN